jgi:hypothetical protein
VGQTLHHGEGFHGGQVTRDFDRQTAELQVRIAILNRFTALGIPVTQPVG